LPISSYVVVRRNKGMSPLKRTFGNEVGNLWLKGHLIWCSN